MSPRPRRRISNAQVIADLRRVAEELGHPPSSTEYRHHGALNHGMPVARWGSWRAALLAAGFSRGSLIRQRVSDDELLANLRQVTRELGRQPTLKEFKLHARRSDQLLIERFGGYRNFVEAAGLVYARADSEPTDAEVAADVRAVAKRLGFPPTAHQYLEHGKFVPAVAYRRAPERHWWGVLMWALDLPKEEAKKHAFGRRGYRTTEERLEELRALAKKLRRTPPRDEAEARGIQTLTLVQRLGSWEAVIHAAKLPKPQSKSRPSWHLTDEELAREVRRVARKLGRFPSAQSFDKLSRINHKTVAKRLGGGKWSSVREALGGGLKNGLQ